MTPTQINNITLTQIIVNTLPQYEITGIILSQHDRSYHLQILYDPQTKPNDIHGKENTLQSKLKPYGDFTIHIFPIAQINESMHDHPDLDVIYDKNKGDISGTKET